MPSAAILHEVLAVNNYAVVIMATSQHCEATTRRAHCPTLGIIQYLYLVIFNLI